MKKKTGKYWLLLGILFIIILFVYAILKNNNIVSGSHTFETLVSAIFGTGGFIFIVVGIIKMIIEKLRKN